jgi:protein TonB
MDTSKILTADLLDILFDERNKDYGAYELRKTYGRRVKTALLFTFAITTVTIGGSVLAKSLSAEKNSKIPRDIIVVSAIPDEKKLEEIKEPERQADPEPERQERLTQIQIVPNEEVDEPLPTQEDLAIAEIGTEKIEGVDDKPLSDPVGDPDGGKNMIDVPEKEPEDLIYSDVQVHAKYLGNWERFLLRNLNADIPRDNGASPGRYTIKVQFVVDKEGNVSDIKALTNEGYGMEEEAVRVLKKADKWEPAIQNGFKVRAYHTQMITFVIPEE